MSSGFSRNGFHHGGKSKLSDGKNTSNFDADTSYSFVSFLNKPTEPNSRSSLGYVENERRTHMTIPDLIRGVKGMREKLSKLDAAKSTTVEKMNGIVRATDDYTNVLSRWPPCQDYQEISTLDSTDLTTRNVDSYNLLDDANIRNRFDRLRERIAQLECQTAKPSSVYVNRSTSMNLSQRNGYRSFVDDVLTMGRGKSRSTTLSDVEKSRCAPALSLSKDPADGEFHGSESSINKGIHSGIFANDRQKDETYIHRMPYTADVENMPNTNEQLNRSTVSRSSASSSLKHLNDIQLSKLKRFQDEFRSDMNHHPGLFSDSPPRRLVDLEDQPNQSKQVCGRCGATDLVHCQCNRRSTSTAAFGMTSNGKNLLGRSLSSPKDNEDVKRNGHLSSIDRSSVSSASEEFQGGMTAFSKEYQIPMSDNVTETEIRRRLDCNRPSSVPTSPIRHPVKTDFSVSRRGLPFVSGKSAGKSHSVLVNLQQLLALLKVQNPHLYQTFRNLDGESLSSAHLADMFLRELDQLLAKRKDELTKLLRNYDDLSSETKHPSLVPKESTDLKRRINKVARMIEMKDNEIEHLQKQYQMVQDFRKDVIMRQELRRQCQRQQLSTPGNMPESKSTFNFAKHTNSTAMKAIPSRSKSENRTTSTYIRASREIKAMASTLQ